MLKKSEGKLRRILLVNMILALGIMSFETYAQQKKKPGMGGKPGPSKTIPQGPKHKPGPGPGPKPGPAPKYKPVPQPGPIGRRSPIPHRRNVPVVRRHMPKILNSGPIYLQLGGVAAYQTIPLTSLIAQKMHGRMIAGNLGLQSVARVTLKAKSAMGFGSLKLVNALGQIVDVERTISVYPETITLSTAGALGPMLLQNLKLVAQGNIVIQNATIVLK